MLNLAKGLGSILSRFGNSKKIEEKDIQEIFQTLKVALLEADVALPVTEIFANSLRDKLIGSEISKKADPSDYVLTQIYDGLVDVLQTKKVENENDIIAFDPSKKPNVIMMVGLQGAGKTTTTAKLANHLNSIGKKALTISVDLKRPAAIEQLAIVCAQSNIDNYKFIKEAETTEYAVKLCQQALKSAQESGHDYLILDTAGRKSIDEEMMNEVREVSKALKPCETIFVSDAMMGRSSFETVQNFSNALGITGVILTRTEGDSRGGVALNVKTLLGCQVLFSGTGEKISDFEPFYPERAATKMLDMGDLMTLVDKAKKAIGESEAESMQQKITSGRMDFNDLLKQISSIKKMGSIKSMLSMIPGASSLMGQIDDNRISGFYDFEHMILSMTKRERSNPNLICTSSSRKNRVAKGSGKSPSDVNKMIKKFRQMKDAMGIMSGMDTSSLLKNFNSDSIKDILK